VKTSQHKGLLVSLKRG